MTNMCATIECFKKRSFCVAFIARIATLDFVQPRSVRPPNALGVYLLGISISSSKSTGNIASVRMKVYLRRLAMRLLSSSHFGLQNSLLIGVGVEQMGQCLCLMMTGTVSF